MKYGVGDKLVFPVHGAGTVTSIAEQEVHGESVSYYNVEFPYGNLKLMVPTANTDALGIRPVMKASEIPAVMEFIRTADCDVMNGNWNKRQRENLDRIRSTDIHEAAVIYKFLFLKNMDKSLSTGEKKMMTNAKHILFSELVLSGNMSFEELDQNIKDVILSGKK